MTDSPEGLLTIQDFIRWGASRFNAKGLFFGHGTDNALDEAAQLVLHALHLHLLPTDLAATYHGSRLTFPERGAVCDLLERRINERKPTAYLINRAWFAGLEFYINEDVVVPRSPLAELVEADFDPWVEPEGLHRILDLGTGSGCIGIACAVYLPEVEVDLAEVSPAALEVASANLARHHLEERVQLLQSDLFENIGDRRYDIIISNPPYVSTAELATLPEEYRKEPRLGLSGGKTGLDLVLRILRDAPAHLEEGGVLVVEVGSAAAELERRFPDLPFLWLEFERGGEGVFLMQLEQLVEFNPLFEKELEKL